MGTYLITLSAMLCYIYFSMKVFCSLKMSAMFVLIVIMLILPIFNARKMSQCLEDDALEYVCQELVEALKNRDCMYVNDASARVSCAKIEAERVYSRVKGGSLRGNQIWQCCKERDQLEEVLEITNANIKNKLGHRCMEDEVLVDGVCVQHKCNMNEVMDDNGDCVIPCEEPMIRVRGECIQKMKREGRIGFVTLATGKVVSTVAFFKMVSEGTFELKDIKILPVGPFSFTLDMLKGAFEKWIKGI